MSLINKEKVLNGVGKAVDATNSMADKASTFVKEKEIDKKAMKAAKTAEKGIKMEEIRLERLPERLLQVTRARLAELLLRLRVHLQQEAQHLILLLMQKMLQNIQVMRNSNAKRFFTGKSLEKCY